VQGLLLKYITLNFFHKLAQSLPVLILTLLQYSLEKLFTSLKPVPSLNPDDFFVDFIFIAYVGCKQSVKTFLFLSDQVLLFIDEIIVFLLHRIYLILSPFNVILKFLYIYECWLLRINDFRLLDLRNLNIWLALKLFEKLLYYFKF
jgi:hypothetical protein